MKNLRLSAFAAITMSAIVLSSCGGEAKKEVETPEVATPVEEVAPVEVESEAVLEEDTLAEAPVEVEAETVVEEVAEPVATKEVKTAIETKVKPVAAKVEEKVEEVAGQPAMEFTKSEYDFGDINQGDKVSYTFEFKNTGNAPLVISNARASCGCTVPQWPKEPVAPGATSKIDVVFNSAGKRGRQTKSITITTNITEKPQQQVFLKGMVNIPAPEEAPAAE